MIPAITPRPRTGGDAVLEALEREGVDVIFGYPGGTIMPFYDALYGHPMRHILVRHEAGAAFAAGGYARTSGRVGVCCATSGPGATNLVTGLVDAMMDSIPVVAITGQVRTALMGTDGFQEADVCAITQCTTKASILVTDPAQIYTKVREAFALARSGRPGPVLVDIPTDVLKAPYVPEQNPPRKLRDVKPVASKESIKAAADAIRNAHRPVAIAGGGARDPKAVKAFRQLNALLGMPNTTTICGLGASDPNDTRGLGMLGMHGTKAANLTVHTADVVLAFGMRFDDRVTGRPDRFVAGATVVHNDIDATEFNKIIATDIPLHGDSADVINAIIAELKTSHVPRFDDWAIQAKALGGPLPSDDAKDGHLSATDFLDQFLAKMPEKSIVCTDVGQHQMWTAQRIKPDTPRDFCTSAGLGSMGFGFPSAIGACFANPGRPVFAVCGDGGFQMTMPELATVKRYQVPVKIVLIDNRNLGMVRQWQELFYDERYSATNLSDNPDFCTIASAYDIESFRINGPEDAAATLDAFLAYNGPALLHASCYPDELVWPMIPSGGVVEDLMESKGITA
jgi:acetolactate synthase-1/2/3 large subunit